MAYTQEDFQEWIFFISDKDLENKKNAYYAMPILKDLNSRRAGSMTPLIDATASLNRRTGTYLSTIFRYKIELSKETDD